MANRYQSFSFTTASVASAAVLQASQVLGPHCYNLVKLKITRTTGNGNINFRIFKKGAWGSANRLIRFENQPVPLLHPVDQTSGSPGVEALEGIPLPVDDEDGTNNDGTGHLHYELENLGTTSTFTISGEFEELAVFGSAGEVSFRTRLGLGAPAHATTPLLISGNSGTLPGPVNDDYIHIVGGDGKYAEILIDSFGVQPLFYSRRANGTNASKSALVVNDVMFQISSRGYGATGYCTGGRAEITGNAGENWTDAAQGAYLRFFVTPNGTTTLTEAVQISNASNLGIGTNPTPDTRLTVSKNASTPALIDTGILAHYIGGNGDFTGIQFDQIAANPYGLIFRRANNTAGSPNALANADIIGQIQARGYGSTAYSGNRAYVLIDTLQAWTDANQGTRIKLGVTPLNSNVVADALIITSLALTPGVTDNAIDFGSTAFRFKDGHFGGTLQFGTYTATPGTITGYITITDAGGASRKLAVTT